MQTIQETQYLPPLGATTIVSWVFLQGHPMYIQEKKIQISSNLLQIVDAETERHMRLRVKPPANKMKKPTPVVWRGRSRSNTKPDWASPCTTQAAVGKEDLLFEETCLSPPTLSPYPHYRAPHTEMVTCDCFHLTVFPSSVK